jgi:colanic acid/amylovoran biosynthesis glycosyltransferase
MKGDGKRVVLIADRFPVASETFIVQRFLRLLDRGWDIHVLCSETRTADQAMFREFSMRPEIGTRVHERPSTRPKAVALAQLPFILLRSMLLSPARTVRYLARGWGAMGPKIVKALYYDHPLVRLAPDVLHFTFGWFAPGREYLAEALDAKLVVSFQGGDLNYGGLESDPGYYAGVWRKAAAIHFLGQDLRRRATTRGYVPDERNVVIVPGIDLGSFVAQPRERVAGEPLRLLSVARLHWKKGYDYALQAVRHLVDEGIECRYRIVGDGPGREAAVYARHDLRLENVVEFLGEQSASCIRAEMQWADVFLHAATSEGFCYAALEAQAMELPVVTSDADGLPENVADGQTGFVVPRRDAEALARAVAKLAHDPELRTRIGAAGRARVSELFDVEREIDGFDALYRIAIDG